mmetsp:Transcript_4458/g.8854  ORF Transcript_4458/g.8854 Transcript_4458/m.8854 type:complete len:283 (-) Transcript_4458:1507-2355(-)
MLIGSSRQLANDVQLLNEIITDGMDITSGASICIEYICSPRLSLTTTTPKAPCFSRFPTLTVKKHSPRMTTTIFPSTCFPSDSGVHALKSLFGSSLDVNAARHLHNPSILLPVPPSPSSSTVLLVGTPCSAFDEASSPCSGYGANMFPLSFPSDSRGPNFADACRIVRIPPHASGASTMIPSTQKGSNISTTQTMQLPHLTESRRLLISSFTPHHLTALHLKVIFVLIVGTRKFRHDARCSGETPNPKAGSSEGLGFAHQGLGFTISVLGFWPEIGQDRFDR